MMMYQQKIDNNQQQNPLNNYLVTQAVNTEQLPQNKLSDDLAALNQQEKKVNYKVDISNGIENPSLSRAMQALRLANPFKGY